MMGSGKQKSQGVNGKPLCFSWSSCPLFPPNEQEEITPAQSQQMDTEEGLVP